MIVLAVRYLGFFAATHLRTIQFNFTSHSDLASAPFLDFDWPSHLVFANSISWFFVAVTLAVLFGFILFRNFYFHEDWIHPRAASRLHNRNLEFLITQRREAFYQAVSWLVLTVILGSSAIAEVLAGQLAILTFGIVWAISVGLVLIFFLQTAQGRKLRR